MVAHGLLFGPAIKHLKASQGCAGWSWTLCLFSGGLEPCYNCTQQTLHYSVEHGDFLCFFIIKNLEKQPRFSLFFLVCMDNTLDPGLFIYLFIYIPPLGFVMLKILGKSTIK